MLIIVDYSKMSAYTISIHVTTTLPALQSAIPIGINYRRVVNIFEDSTGLERNILVEKTYTGILMLFGNCSSQLPRLIE